MAVNHVVPVIVRNRPDEAKAFYGGILRMDIAIDPGWIVTFADTPSAGSRSTAQFGIAQISAAPEGGMTDQSCAENIAIPAGHPKKHKEALKKSEFYTVPYVTPIKYSPPRDGASGLSLFSATPAR